MNKCCSSLDYLLCLFLAFVPFSIPFQEVDCFAATKFQRRIHQFIKQGTWLNRTKSQCVICVLMEAIATDVENKEDREGCLERDKKGEKVAKNSER